VGCKVEVNDKERSRCCGFYLNYVGCKDIWLSKELTNTEKFYLNYVGCKGISSMSISLGKSCFI